MIEVRGFNGKLNLDDNPYRLPNGDYSDALNITRDAQGTGQDEVVSNVVGNTEVPYTFEPDTINKVIGNYADKVRNRQYIFVWNEGGYHEITYYDANTNTIVKVIKNITDTGGENVLNFDISYKINHIDIIYRDEGGDLLYWTDGYNPPRKVNVKTATTGGYGIIISSYLDVAKEPPSAPPYCVYEDNTGVIVNNLNNKQFKFKYRYVFDDLEKSVTSAQSEVPIPKNYSNQNTVADPNKNSSIFILLDSGPPNVTKIEILGAESLGVNWSDFFLITVLDKSELGIFNNNTAQFSFFNDQAYSIIPINESIQPFDNVPQKAYTQSLPNGNVLNYGAITENYDLLVPNYQSIILNNSLLSSRINQTALVRVYSVIDPFLGQGLKIIIAGAPSLGDLYSINYTNNGVPLTVTVTALGSTTGSLQANIYSDLSISGYTVTYIPNTYNLFVTTLPGFLLGTNLPATIIPAPTLQTYDSQFTYDWFSRYSYGVVYFDEKGRTNGLITSISSTFETQSYNELNSLAASPVYIPQQQFSINNRPPNWASYFEIVRTKNLTKSDFLYWVSESTFKDNVSNQSGYQYAYISISSLTQYLIDNPEIKTLGYEFTVGDRIRFVKLYSSTGATSQVYTDKDYEIIASLVNPIVNGFQLNGQVLKIVLPTINPGTFDFGTNQFANYLIEIYTPAPNFSNLLNLYYEFGEKYEIGNPGTAQAFHYGMLQNQTSNLSQPALYNFWKGDSYFRYRLYPKGGTLKWKMPPSSGVLNGPQFVLADLIIDNSNNSDYSPQSVTSISPSPVVTNFPLIIANTTNQITFKVKIFLRFKSLVSSLYGGGRLFTNEYNSSGTLLFNRPLIGLGPMVAGIEKIISIEVLLTPAINTAWLGWYISGFNGQIYEWEMTLLDPTSVFQGIIDPNFSDTYDSSALPNGRAWSYDPNAAQEFNPTLIRFGGEYQAGTTVNQTNRFYEENFDVYDRSRGSIKKMFIEGRNQYIFQQFDVGVVTVLTQIVKDTAGNPLSAQSDSLLNKIVYPYVGGYGIGDMPESFAYGKNSKYFIDSNKGVVCRLAANGITPLSIVYKTNAFFVEKIGTYKNDLPIPPLKGKPVIYGAFDAYTNKYIIAMEEIIDITDPLDPIQIQQPYTISFLETRDSKEGFETFFDYYPENMGALNNLFITYKDGQLWKHDNPTFCNFYNSQKSASVTVIFNDAQLDKKSFLSIMETANTVWYCSEIKSQLNSYGSTPQSTYIVAARFALLEGQYYSAILRDANSPGGIINGDTMHGNYLKVTFKIDSASNFAYLNTVSLNYNNSPLNLR